MFRKKEKDQPKNCDELGLRLQADQFARKLLMPEEAFRDIYKHIKNTEKLVEIWQVPAEQIDLRIVELGLIDEQPKENTRKARRKD